MFVISLTSWNACAPTARDWKKNAHEKYIFTYEVCGVHDFVSFGDQSACAEKVITTRPNTGVHNLPANVGYTFGK